MLFIVCSLRCSLLLTESLMTRWITATLLAALSAHGVQAAGFDCSKASTAVEKTICADAALSNLDERLAQFYESALARLGDATQCLRQHQRNWLRHVRNQCSDADCLRNAYLERLSELSLLQPGALQAKDLELPDTPRLRWILPGGGDRGDLRNSEIRSARIEGIIGYDEGGYLLTATDGTLHILIPDIFVDEQSALELGVLEETKAKVIVTGTHGVTAGGDPAFDNRQCVTIHVQPSSTSNGDSKQAVTGHHEAP